MECYACRKESWQRQKHKQGSCQVQGQKEVTMQAGCNELFIPFPGCGMDFGGCLIQHIMRSMVMQVKSSMHSWLRKSQHSRNEPAPIGISLLHLHLGLWYCASDNPAPLYPRCDLCSLAKTHCQHQDCRKPNQALKRAFFQVTFTT